MNTEFSYMYRDGSNYKLSGSVIFSGTLGPEDEQIFNESLALECHFIAQQVGIPALWFEDKGYAYDDEDDHPYHEFIGFTKTTKKPTDKRTIGEFIQEVEGVHWDPRLGEHEPDLFL